MATELAPRLDPKAIEPRLYSKWMEKGEFAVHSSEVLVEGREPYVIVIPPPNVTAVLHMGHGLNNTIQDVLIRWRRMQGLASLWAPGTDHAGIATQNVVERLLAKEGKTRDDLGREAFVERTWEFVEETGGAILDQLKAMGCTCDWDRTRFTLDPGLSRAVREVFVRLYEKGLIYRGEYIINWCPRCLTALSNEEAEGDEVEGRLYHLRYPLAEGWADAAAEAQAVARAAASAEAEAEAEGGRAAGVEAIGQLPDGRWYLTVSTTRPETMLGDTAVAVNPADERYKGLIGAEVDLPLTGRRIPIIADDYVDRGFGTGLVKVTPAHDPNDFEMAQRSGVPLLDVMTPGATMGENAPEAFRGMDRFDARKAVVRAFKEEGLFGGDDSHTHTIPRCYRCETVVEPRLSEQWFVKMKPLAEPALQASIDGTVTFVPGRWKKVYEHWMENIRDWCISRQLWWGHRIPVWYCQDCGETIVAREDPDACTACGGAALEQDPDVLDTWFSSWLWPFSIFGWPEDTDDLKAFYPGHVLSTAPEILFFWVARMIMAGYEFLGEAPFKTVYLHATVRDTQGRKMSKSLGNGIDPLEVVDQFGADALRFTVISAAAVGTDIHLDPEDLEASFAPGRNFANKVWNAGRFTLMSVGDDPIKPLSEVGKDLELSDRWILSRLSGTADSLTQELEKFRLHDVAEKAYHFFWGELADWYLELVKPRLRDDAEEGSKQAARTTLVTAFDGILRLLHPLIPFVTEELWQKLPWPEGQLRPESLISAPWPTPDPDRDDPEAETQMDAIQELITQIRRLRKEYGVPEGAQVKAVVSGAPALLEAALAAEDSSIRRLARVSTLTVETGAGTGAEAGEAANKGAHAVLKNGTELFMPLEGVIDLEKERERLSVEIQRLSGQLKGVMGKLENRNFLDRAPEEVVAKEREKEASLREQMEKLQDKLKVFEGL
ncbi:MAG: valine--tRNA ligase [Longimicrobiales bacterium]|nr:valine--tRNA ligase [Longimicrobiales bacterium]